MPNLQVWISPEFHEKIERIASRYGFSPSSVGRALMIEGYRSAVNEHDAPPESVITVLRAQGEEEMPKSSYTDAIPDGGQVVAKIKRFEKLEPGECIRGIYHGLRDRSGKYGVQATPVLIDDEDPDRAVVGLPSHITLVDQLRMVKPGSRVEIRCTGEIQKPELGDDGEPQTWFDYMVIVLLRR